ncbi:MAG: anion transporter [Thermodesulfobacterium sp.]|jgi:Na+/H+ antiporter NhaD/arsenite permease-like protein|nr:anion transporter [Thermodesulfobacterium sp.]
MDIAFFIFLLTYILMALGQPPLFRIDRTGAAIIGASCMIIFDVLSVYEAYEAIDYKTILILFGMMILIANLRLSGFFNIILNFLANRIQSPIFLLYLLIFSSGILSAFFINDTICLIFTPFILDLTKRLKLNPKPYLLALCMSANIGSVATITGNPQNIIIGAASGIPYSTFFIKLFPVALVGLLICALLLQWFYKKELAVSVTKTPELRYRYNKPLVIKSSLLALLTVLLFFLNAPMEVVSIGVGSFLLITRRIKPEKVYNLIDFRLLILFIGLFIVIKGFEKSALFNEMVEAFRDFVKTPLSLVFSCALLSNIVSNVPAVLIFKPLIVNWFNTEKAWLYLALASTFAGNLTILGSIANIIVIEGASSRVKIGFLEYLKVGLPLTVLSLMAGVIILSLF